MQGCSKRYGSGLERTEGKLIEDVKPLNGRCVSGTGDGLSCEMVDVVVLEGIVPPEANGKLVL